MILVTGDTHGDVSRLKKKNTDFEDLNYVMIAGDFGMIWGGSPSKEEEYWFKWLDEKPFETIITLGNHENYERIYNLPVEERFGAPVFKVSEKVYILQHGYKYIIDGKSFFNFGGADSIDKENRRSRITWWEEEIPTYADFQRGWETCLANDFKFDYVITHTAPTQAIDEMDRLTPDQVWGGKNYYNLKGGDPTCKLLNQFSEKIECKKWIFGHFHRNTEFAVVNNEHPRELQNRDYIVLYENFYKIGD